MKSEHQKLIKLLDKEFSIFIRKRDKDKGCITCGIKKDWKLMDCGHYLRRGLMATRWNERNTAMQCKKCNGWNEGEKDIFRKKLVEMYGLPFVELIESERYKPAHISTNELKIMILHYRKLNEN